MVNKKDNTINMLKDELNNKDKELRDTEMEFKKLMEANNDLLTENNNLKKENQMNYTNPYTNLELEGQPYLDENMINTNMSIMVKQRMAGLYSTLNNSTGTKGATLNMGVWFSYLFILERAKYFMSCCQIETQLDDVAKIVYLALYYGSLNGTIGFTMDEKGCYLFYITEKKIDKYGKVEWVKGATFNYYNSTDFKEEKVSLAGEQVAIFDFNNEDFGLWVLAWDYVNKLYGFLQIMINQTKLLNKRFVLRTDTNNMNLRSEVSQMLRNPSILIALKNDVELKQLETPDFDLNQIWQAIENYTNYFDFHFLNMRVKDMDSSDKERDIASQQTNHATQNDNKNQFIDYYIEKFIREINAKFNTDLVWHNRMISQDDGVVAQTQTLNKLKGGDENEQHD